MENSTADWGSWFQTVAGGVVDKWSSATYQQPFEVQKLRIQALGSEGYYSEGQPGAGAQPGTMRAGLNLSPAMLLLAGAAVLAVVLLKD